MNPFADFLTDTITLVKADGTEVKDIKASVNKPKISVFETMLHIDLEDRIVRSLPSGQIEEFIVEEVNYNQAFHSIPAHWSILCRKGNQSPRVPQHITYNLSGMNARINVNSHDCSNTFSQPVSPAVFDALQQVVASQIAAEFDRRQILQRIGEMEKTYGTPAFLAGYQRFMAAAANHMTVVGPFLPALAALLHS